MFDANYLTMCLYSIILLSLAFAALRKETNMCFQNKHARKTEATVELLSKSLISRLAVIGQM